jgi:hypothetical protein
MPATVNRDDSLPGGKTYPRAEEPASGGREWTVDHDWDARKKLSRRTTPSR